MGYRNQNARRGGSGRLLSLTLLFATALSLSLPLLSPDAQADEALTYDANGNIVSRTLPGGSTTYTYDPLNRVDVETGPAGNRNYDFDANDNRTTDGAGTTATYTANSDRIATLNGASVTLDAAGNTTAARGYLYTWTQAGQLKTVSQGATLLATYTYDYQGRRTKKVTTASAPQGAATVIYHYDQPGHLLAETTATGSPIATYVWREDTPVSLIVAGSGSTPETALYLETDHLNTPIAARDQTGKVVWKWESDAFGTTAANEDPDADSKTVTINLRFPGQYYDKESGLHYNWHRYYDPKLGRYLSSDPIGLAGGGNTFGYVGGNPLSYVDPLGLQALPVPIPPLGMPGAANDPKFGPKVEVLPGSGIRERNGGGGGGGCDCEDWKKKLDNAYIALEKMKRTSGILWNSTVTMWEEMFFWASVKKYEADCGPYSPPYSREPDPQAIHDFYGK